jgi:hypothetical protein
MRRMVRDPVVGGAAALTVLATWSLWGEVVKGGNDYILTETGAIVWRLCREKARLLVDGPAPGCDLYIVRDLVGSRFTTPQKA